MSRGVALIVLLVFLFPSLVALGAEKLKFGSGSKTSPLQYLPVLAAKEKGFWEKNGLEGEWVPFDGGGPFMRAMAAKAVKVGYSATPTVLPAASRGLPLIIVSDLYVADFSYWVFANSSLKGPQDVAGTKVGIHSLGGTGWALARLAASALGVEKDVRFVALGGLSTRLAALKTKRVDAMVTDFTSVAGLVASGELRELVRIKDYIPRPWVENILVAHQEMVKEEPQVVKRVVKASLESVRFVSDNFSWAKEKLKAISGHSEEAARLVHQSLASGYSKDGKINRQALENVTAFLIEFGLLPKEKPARIEEIYTSAFLD